MRADLEKMVHSLASHKRETLASVISPRGEITHSTNAQAGESRDALGETVMAEVQTRKDLDLAAQDRSVQQPERRFIEISNLEAVGLELADVMQGEMADDYRHIKRALINTALAEREDTNGLANLILVTSAISQEGKTFNAVNLAMSMALEYDYNVLLIDADFLLPTISRAIKLDAKRGFIDAVIDPSVNLSEVLCRTEVPNLSILPAGRPYSRTTELVASAAMKSTLAEISTRYANRLIIVDGPPLLATSEARVLVQVVGQVIVVIEAGKTPSSIVNEALKLVKNASNVSLLLNKTWRRNRKHYYRYYSQ